MVDEVRVPARHGVLDAPLGERVRQAVGCRNVLVHDYVDIVRRRLDDPRDLDEFATAVGRWFGSTRR